MDWCESAEVLSPQEYKEKLGHALTLLYDLGNNKCYQGAIQQDVRDVYENLDNIYFTLGESMENVNER